MYKYLAHAWLQQSFKRFLLSSCWWPCNLFCWYKVIMLHIYTLLSSKYTSIMTLALVTLTLRQYLMYLVRFFVILYVGLCLWPSVFLMHMNSFSAVCFVASRLISGSSHMVAWMLDVQWHPLVVLLTRTRRNELLRRFGLHSLVAYHAPLLHVAVKISCCHSNGKQMSQTSAHWSSSTYITV
jgi:hypothetical protein